MSFILDALKKSESDRQQQNAPGISAVPAGTVKATVPRWLWALIILLVVNLLVLTVVLIKPATSPVPTAIVSKPAAARAAIPEADPLPKVAPATVRRDIPPQIEPKEAPPRTTETRPPVDQHQTVVRAPVQAGTDAQTTFNDLRASGNLSLPDLNVDIHVYSEQPADRFIFINMNQYRENATLAEGPVLREITPEGAILEYAGAVFLLPRD